MPIENTTEGVVNHTLDMFVDSNLLIYGEVLQEVAHHLMSKSGVAGDKRIYSHPHASRNAVIGWKRICLHVPVSGGRRARLVLQNFVDDPSAAASHPVGITLLQVESRDGE